MPNFFVPGTPVGQPRPRAGIAPGGSFARVYDDAKHPVTEFKADIRRIAQEHFSAPLDGPVQVQIVASFPRPKRLIWKKREMPRVFHTSKPDGDNIGKAVLDALGPGKKRKLPPIAWHDDAQVCRLTIDKYYVAAGEVAGVEVQIYLLTGCDLAPPF